MHQSARFPALALLCNVGYGCVLLVLAVAPRLPALPEPVTDLDAHALAYGLEAALLYWLAYCWCSPPASAAFAWLGANAFGVCTEILQHFEPSRTSEARDMGADLFGVTLTILALVLARRLPALARALRSPAVQVTS